MILNDENNSGTGSNYGKAWSDDELTILYNLKKSGMTYKQTADVMRHSPCAARVYNENLLQKKWMQTDWEEFERTKHNRENAAEEQDEKQKVIETTIANHEKLIKRDRARTDIIIDAMKTAIYRLPKPKPCDIECKTSQDDHYSEEHMGVMISDIHAGAKYTLGETGGLGEYNMEITRRRINVLKESLVSIAERHRHMYEIPHLHIFCLGDIVAGMNDAGNWSPTYIDLDIYDQMVAGFAALRDLVASWSKVFPKVTFYGVYGNHGRIGKRGTHKVSSNWDRVVYDLTKESLSEYDNIEWEIPETWWINKTILNHSFYITHGDGIRSSMGIPYYGVERAQSRIAGLLPNKVDYTMIGHFHSTAELSTGFGKVLINGSFMGGDMYSLRDLGKGDVAEQKIFGIHPKKGITWGYNINLD